MGDSGRFACPECGNELKVKRTTAGLKVRCGWCETWVEIPFLPREIRPRKRFSHRGGRPAWVPWAWGGLGILALLLAFTGTSRFLAARGRHRSERALNALISKAKAEEETGHFDAAASAIELALKQELETKGGRPERRERLQRHRDRIVRKAAEARIQAASASPPDVAVATYKELLKRQWEDGALEGLEATLRQKLEETRLRWSESDLSKARRLVEEGNAALAFDLCERTWKTTRELESRDKERLEAEVNQVALNLIRQRGVSYTPARGEFTFGTPRSYKENLSHILGPVLAHLGYLPVRPDSTWAQEWDTQAAHQVAAQVVERLGPLYLDSQGQISLLSLTVTLKHGESSVWQGGPLIAQTQASIPSLTAFTTSRLTLDKGKRNEFERLLYDDARATLEGKLHRSLRTLPQYRVFGGSGTGMVSSPRSEPTMPR